MPCFAHQPKDGDVWASAGLYPIHNVGRDHATDVPTLGGFGLIAEADIDRHGGPEISFFYLRQFYSIQENGRVLDTIGKRI